MTERDVMNTAMSRALTVFFWIMAFSVNDEIFYDHTVTKQPIIFEITFRLPFMDSLELQKSERSGCSPALSPGRFA
jgi:hypothetical protein